MQQRPTSPATDTTHPRLAPVLGFAAAVSLVVGEVIGSGVFLKPSQVAQATGGHVALILTLWVVCGLVNLCGALTLAELSAMLPHAGGTYVFLREAFGRRWAFLWSWAEFWVIRTGAIAGLAVALAIFLGQLSAQAGWIETIDTSSPASALQARAHFEKIVAVTAIVLLATVNILGTRWGGAVQVVTATLKAGMLVFLAVLPFVAVGAAPHEPASLWPASIDRGLLAGLGTALAGIMWAYDGWGQVTVVAEEIRDPQRNIPRALAGGVILLIVLYLGANIAYHVTLSSDAIARSEAVAVDVSRALLGYRGTQIMTAGLMISVFGALNSNVLVGPRVLFAMARDHQPLGLLRRIDPRFGTPALGIGLLCGWAIVLILASDLPALLMRAAGVQPEEHPKRLFDVLTNYAIFGGSIFYLTAVMAVFVLRVTQPEWPRPYRTWGYPLVPGIFVTAYIFLLATMLWSNPRECLSGLVLIGLGAVAYQGLQVWTRAGQRGVDRPQ